MSKKTHTAKTAWNLLLILIPHCIYNQHLLHHVVLVTFLCHNLILSWARKVSANKLVPDQSCGSHHSDDLKRGRLKRREDLANLLWVKPNTASVIHPTTVAPRIIVTTKK